MAGRFKESEAARFFMDKGDETRISPELTIKQIELEMDRLWLKQQEIELKHAELTVELKSCDIEMQVAHEKINLKQMQIDCILEQTKSQTQITNA